MTGGRTALSGFEHPYLYRKPVNMGEILIAVATKAAIALAEAILLRLVWQLYAAFSRSLRTVSVPAVA